MKTNNTQKGNLLPLYFPLQSAHAISRTSSITNTVLNIFHTPQPKAMKTILTVMLALIIQLSVFSQITSFAAQWRTDKVDLKWAISLEKDISHYSIEKSTDGKNYSQAGIVFAFGNGSEPMVYPFSDKNINSAYEGVIYYRIMTVDNNGKTETIQERSITIKKSTGDLLMTNVANTAYNTNKI